MATTTYLQLNQPAYNSSAWDVPLNANETILDNAFGGTTSISVTNSNVLLTATQLQAMQIKFTGTLSANIGVAIPAGNYGRWTFTNATSGPYTLTINQFGGGTTVAVPQGYSSLLACDSTGVFAADGGLVTGSPTFTNLTVTGSLVSGNLSGRFNPRVNSQTSPSSITADIGTYDQYVVTALANSLSFVASTTGTPLNGNKLIFRIKDNGSAQSLSWGTTGAGGYRAIGVTLPTTTVSSKVLYVGCIYNSTESFWDVVAVNLQG